MNLPLYYFLAITAIYILMSWAIYIPYRMGQLHFMAVANMALSAYFAALAAINWGWPFWLVLAAGTLMGGLIGWLISFAIGDAPCFAVVIVGFTLTYLIKTIIENTEALGGSLGIFSIPKILSTPGGHRNLMLILAYLFVLIVGFLLLRIERSRLGRAASTIFIDRDLAASFGVNIKKMGMFLQTFSSAVGGLSGVMYAFIMGAISPNHFTFHIVGTCMTMLFVGGFTTPWGILLTAPILWGLPLIFPRAIQSWKVVIYGILLITVLILKPEGFITRPFLTKLRQKINRPGSKKTRNIVI